MTQLNPTLQRWSRKRRRKWIRRYKLHVDDQNYRATKQMQRLGLKLAAMWRPASQTIYKPVVHPRVFPPPATNYCVRVTPLQDT